MGSFSSKNEFNCEDEIDLHGFDTKTAIKELKFRIDKAEMEGYKKLVVITGQGNHSGARGPRIKPAVLNLAKQWNLKTEAVDNNPGRIVLYVERQLDYADVIIFAFLIWFAKNHVHF